MIELWNALPLYKTVVKKKSHVNAALNANKVTESTPSAQNTAPALGWK